MSTDAPVTEPIPVQGRAFRRVGAPTVVRALSGVTVLAVLAGSTWYAGVERTVTVSAPVVAQQAAVAALPPVSSTPPPAVGAAPARAVPPPRAPAAPAAGAPAAAVAISPGAGGTTLPGATPIAPGGTGAAGAGTGAPAPGASTPLGDDTAGGLAVAPVTEQAPCPIAVPEPDRIGGLSSIVELAPGFGPLASEVFALGPAIQPLMQLAGPFLAELEPVIHQNLPFLTPILERIAGASTVVLQAILPFYGPYREQFIAAEGRFAASIAPILRKTYESPAAACLVAFEGEIIRAANGRPITAPSLSRPGRVVSYGPRR